jgi:hypothetical protein
MSLGLGEFKKLLKLAGVGSSSGGGSTTPPGQTVRNIATRCRQNYQTVASVQAMKSKSQHTNMGDHILAADGVQIVVGNWYANNTGEFSGPATSTEMISIEYPQGVYKLSTFGGNQSTTCAAGSNVTTDAIKLAIPKGATFWVHRWQTFPSAVSIPVSANAVTISTFDVATQYSAAQLAALTVDPRSFLTGMTASGGTAGGAWTMYPLAVLGKSSVPSVIGYGDSRMSGRSDAQSTLTTAADFGYFGMGEVFRSIGHLLPYTNCGCETDTIQQFNAFPTFRSNLAQYHTHVHFEYGVNDLTAGRTAAVIQAALQAGYALFPTKKISQSTIPPVTASTDTWLTLANQTTAGTNPQRVILNNWIRTKPSPLWAYFEVADAVESARDSGLWKAPTGSTGIYSPVTGDGTHETPYGYSLIQLSNAIDPTLFV